MPKNLTIRRPVAAFTLLEIMIVVGILAILLAITVPSFLRSRSVANETAAAAELRNLVTTEGTWRQSDADHNDIADYWTADLSGMYRCEARPAGSGSYTAMIDAAFAAADDNKESGGAAVGGAAVPGTGIPTANLLSYVRLASRSGYFYRALTNDLSSVPAAVYRTDPDGNGQPFTNTARFAFQARPDLYGTTGTNIFIVNEAGITYQKDFGNNLAANAADWPAANPTSVGWRSIQ